MTLFSKKKSEKILIYGAGALGRGFLAPIFFNLGYDIYFVEKNPEITNELKLRNTYKTAFSEKNSYKIVDVEYSGAFFPGEENQILDSVDFVFSCVGPNNTKEFAEKLRNVKTVISFENDRESANKIKQISGNKNCYFGIPDVITSNVCCNKLKKLDSLCLISERGEIFVEEGDFKLRGVTAYEKTELDKHWYCKFYIHNTPHAAAAFLGKLCGVEYVHEAMEIPSVSFIVSSIMTNTQESLVLKKMVEKDFSDYYAKKELERFKDKLLFDPISRVGRDPLRKLKKNDRLIQSLMLINDCGKDTKPLSLVIKAVLHDAFKNYRNLLVETLKGNPTEEEVLIKISGLEQEKDLIAEITGKSILNKIFPSPLIKLERLYFNKNGKMC